MQPTISNTHTNEDKETAALLACYRLLLRKVAERKARLKKEDETAVSESFKGEPDENPN